VLLANQRKVLASDKLIEPEGSRDLGAHTSAFDYNQAINGKANQKQQPDLIDEPADVFRTETQFIRADGRAVRVAILNYLVRDSFDRALYVEGLVLDTSALRTERSLSGG